MTTLNTCDCTHQFDTLNSSKLLFINTNVPCSNWLRRSLKRIIEISIRSRNLPFIVFFNDSFSSCSHTGRQLFIFPDHLLSMIPGQ